MLIFRFPFYLRHDEAVKISRHLTLLLYIAAIALESKLNKVRIPERLVRIIARNRLKFSFKVEISKRGKADHSALRCCLHH